jgi:signal transduction histidine kinase/DNA-binding NarL/FixJ family response regulator
MAGAWFDFSGGYVYLRTKISLNFLLMALLMIAISAGYLVASRMMNEQFTAMSNQNIPAMEALGEARELLWGLWETREDEARTVAAFRKAEALLLDYRQATWIPRGTDHARELRRELLEVQEGFDGIALEQFNHHLEKVNVIFAEALSDESAFLGQTSDRMLALNQQVSWLSLTLIGVAVFLCLLPGWWLATGISSALNDARQAADQVAAGDLTQQLPEKGQNEISKLAAAFNRMVDTIRQADEEITREVDDRVRAERKAQVAAKAKSDFLAHMSHEFRTPLNGILGYSQMLAMDKGLSEKNLEVVKSLKKSGESLLELINDVLDLTKIEAQKMNVLKTRFYLGDFLESLSEGYAEQVKRKGIDYKLHMEESLPEDILADQIRLRQILVNLLGNAIKFTDKGEIGIVVTPTEGGIRFAVFDSGIGIAPENFEMVLQPFQQVDHRDRQHHGTGLGLPLTSRLLEMMGSSLNIKSEVGEGSTFWFDLPQPDIKSRKLVQATSRITGYRGETRKVLVAEESIGPAAHLIPLLQKVGFNTLHAREPETFVNSCQFFAPDVILLDLYFGEADGVERMLEVQKVYDRVRENSSPPFLMFSDHRKPDDRERSLRSGASAFLGAPIRFADLLASLKDELHLEWMESSMEGSGDEEGASDSEVPSPEVSPDPQQLQELLTLTRAGNVRQLREKLQSLQDEDVDLNKFCNRMLELTGDYRMNAILQDLETQADETSKENP